MATRIAKTTINRSKQLRLIVKSIRHQTSLFKQHPKFTLYSILAIVFISVLSLILLFKDVPNPNKLTRNPAPVSTLLLDRNGETLYEVFSDQNRTPIKIVDLPIYIKQATIAIEDKNFYKHFGLDFLGIARAAINTLSGKRLEGGSTLTQQLVKIALLEDPRRNVVRKVREAVLSIVTEIVYTKDQILELYLNHAPYGGTAYGIEAASQLFFDKSAKDLTLAEATLIVGLPQSPTRYSPFGANPDLAISRQQQVVRRMVEDGYLTQAQADEIKNTKLTFASRKATIKAPHFSLWVRDLLVEKYGEERVNLGGLRVTTTLDLSIQQTAEASVSAEMAKIAKLKIGNGAALITRPKTGEILAMVGSKDYFDTAGDGNVNVTMRLRQPGSSIKPLNFALGLLNGWTASTAFLDYPTCFQVSGQKAYCPKNYDNSFHGAVQLRFALGNSYNIPAVKQLALNGIKEFVATASAMGITTWTNPDNYGLSLTLGGGEVTMTDMAVAYGTFANAGVTVPLDPILKVETYTGEVLEEKNLTDTADYVSSLPQNYSTFMDRLTVNSKYDPKGIRVSLPEEVAYIISHILLDNNARSASFGPNSQLVIPGKAVSVKTGTTNDLRDNWTIGYTPEILIATWVGNNDGSPMSYVASGVTGASTIWSQLMRQTLKSIPDHFPTQPGGVITKDVCQVSGLLPTPERSCPTRSEIFIKELLPPNEVESRKQIWVRRSDKFPLLPGDTTVDLDLEEHAVLSDPFYKDFCLDCAYPADDKGKINYPTNNINFNNFYLNRPTAQKYL